MAFPVSIDDDPAFDAFYAETAAVSGTRRETGAAAPRVLSLSVPCCVMGGDPVDQPGGSLAPADSVSYSVEIRRADWPDHLPPQSGDTLTIEGYPELTCSYCQQDRASWRLACVGKAVPR